jgi:2-polyprenyl-3-methyl-5-hydroxy-6-metoxy-1,4-benzoquinol methylase
MDKDKRIGTWVMPYNDSPKAQIGRWQHNDIESIAEYIMRKIKINTDNVVLDACCGNGLITRIIANHCKEIHGVDF